MQEPVVLMAAMAESAPAGTAAGIDDIVGGLPKMKTESTDDGDTDALTAAELMERWVLCTVVWYCASDAQVAQSIRMSSTPLWRMTGREDRACMLMKIVGHGRCFLESNRALSK